MLIHLYGRQFEIPEVEDLPHRVLMSLVKRFEHEHKALRNKLSLIQGAQVLTLGLAVVLILLVLNFVLNKLVASAIAIYVLISWGVFALILGRRALEAIADSFRQYVQENWRDGSPRFCMNCDYDRRGSPGDACPECGEPIPRVQSTPPQGKPDPLPASPQGEE